jgi:hypothetical protein
MTEYLKTWPTEIYLYGDLDKRFEDQTEMIGWSEENFSKNIKYVRADIAKERENERASLALQLLKELWSHEQQNVLPVRDKVRIEEY